MIRTSLVPTEWAVYYLGEWTSVGPAISTELNEVHASVGPEGVIRLGPSFQVDFKHMLLTEPTTGNSFRMLAPGFAPPRRPWERSGLWPAAYDTVLEPLPPAEWE